MPKMVNKSIYPSDGLYYFEDGGTRLKAEVKNTPTQLRIRLIDDPPYFRDARLDRYMYGTPKKTLVYKKPKLMPNGLYRHEIAHAIRVWNDGDFTLYAGREGVPTLFEKAREYERLTRAKEVAEIIRAYCPDGGTVSYDELRNRYRRLMERSDALKA